ncbi:MAG: hypothetical protein CMQ17_00810 [Gammaproteobacteria bacterium]|nr:hypothetical protein [Gammaproteobacteria bacterium]
MARRCSSLYQLVKYPDQLMNVVAGHPVYKSAYLIDDSACFGFIDLLPVHHTHRQLKCRQLACRAQSAAI